MAEDFREMKLLYAAYWWQFIELFFCPDQLGRSAERLVRLLAAEHVVRLTKVGSINVVSSS